MKKTMIKLLMLLLVSMYIINVGAVRAEEKETIIIVGGWSRTGTVEEINQQLAPMKEALEMVGYRVIIIRPTTHIPLSTASEELYAELLKNNILNEKIVFIGWCWGGLISRRFAEQYQGELNIKTIIQIASPNRGYWFSPQFLFYTDAKKSKEIPLFVVAGNKFAKKWYLLSENDGTVDLKSVLSISAKEQAVFPLSHLELIASREVSEKVIAWIKK